jgi:Flagellar hook capping protein
LQRVLTTVTLLGLLVGTAAAFAITEHLKLIKSPIAGTRVSKVISPVCRCADSKALIQIRLRHADHVTVTILDSNLHKVATVASRESVPRGTPHQFFWDGRTAAGTDAPDGVYRPEVHLSGARHTFVLPNRILLDTTTPKVLSASGGDGVLFPGGGRSLAIRYALSEPANAVVYLGRRQIIRGRPTREHANVKWAGKVDGSPVPRARTCSRSARGIPPATRPPPRNARPSGSSSATSTSRPGSCRCGPAPASRCVS